MNTPKKNKPNDLRLSIDVIDELLKEKISELRMKTNEALENATQKDELEIIKLETETIFMMCKSFVEFNIQCVKENQKVNFLKVKHEFIFELSEVHRDSTQDLRQRIQSIRNCLFESMCNQYRALKEKYPDLQNQYEKHLLGKAEELLAFCENSQISFEQQGSKKISKFKDELKIREN